MTDEEETTLTGLRDQPVFPEIESDKAENLCVNVYHWLFPQRNDGNSRSYLLTGNAFKVGGRMEGKI